MKIVSARSGTPEPSVVTTQYDTIARAEPRKACIARPCKPIDAITGTYRRPDEGTSLRSTE
jgi:hypothetical protein